MPLPLAPILPVLFRLGVVTTTAFAAARWVRGRSHPGRTDQRAEDAFDDLGEGLSLHRPVDRADDKQTNATARMRRVIRIRGTKWEIDAGFMARFRLRRGDE